jgi:16S rRNA (guanine(966)-N(2))-methyltransferase RsmD
MRVISGRARGHSLRYPKGGEIRPTTDRVREALFSSLMAEIPGARFCDLYAGCGSVGIEALSRGAQRAVFVEQNHLCIQALRANLEATGLAGPAEVITDRLPRCLKDVWQKSGPFDIVFADPPYGDDPEPLLEVVSRVLAGSEALFLLQFDSRAELPPGYMNVLQQRKYGKTTITWYAQ